MREASLCRRIFAESESGLKPPTVGRIGARSRPVSRRSLPRWWCGQRVEGGAKGAITAFAVRCPVRRAGLCGRLHLPTQLLITGERHWRSLPRSTNCSPIVSPARPMLVGQAEALLIKFTLTLLRGRTTCPAVGFCTFFYVTVPRLSLIHI